MHPGILKRKVMKHVKRSHLRNHHWPNFPGGNNITGCNPLNITICCDKIGFKKKNQAPKPFLTRLLPTFASDISSYLLVLGALVSHPLNFKSMEMCWGGKRQAHLVQTSIIVSPCICNIPLMGYPPEFFWYFWYFINIQYFESSSNWREPLLPKGLFRIIILYSKPSCKKTFSLNSLP